MRRTEFLKEVFGVEIGEKFYLTNAPEGKGFYVFGSELDLYFRINEFSNPMLVNERISDIRSGKCKIIKEPNVTAEQQQRINGLVLLGFKYIAVDEYNDLLAFREKPYKKDGLGFTGFDSYLPLHCFGEEMNFPWIIREDDEPFKLEYKEIK